jgi:peptidyl-prolyl cis-trans isomerase C
LFAGAAKGRLVIMQRARLAILLLTAVVIAVMGCSKGEDAKQPEAGEATQQTALQTDFDDPTVVLKVNGKEITEGEVAQEISRLMRQFGGGADQQQMGQMQGVLRQQAMDNIISRTLLRQTVKEEGIKITPDEIGQRMEDLRSRFGSDEELDRRLSMMGMNRQLLEEEMTTALGVEKLLAQKAPVPQVTEADAQAYYDENPSQFAEPEQIKASHILIKFDPDDTDEIKAQKRAEAEEILAQLRQGADFAQMASQHSDCPSKERGGDLGYFSRGRMVPPFEEAAFSLGLDELSDIVETEFGYHIIKVTDRQDARAIPFEEAKKDIISFLDAQKKQTALKAYTDELRASANIEYLDTGQ